LIEDPTNPDHLALAATYGIVTTTDRGRSWYHICEASFADLASYTGDPLLDFTNDGAMLVGVQQTLNASRDGCQWTPVLGGDSRFVVDYTVVRSAPRTVVALLATHENGTVVYSLWKSTDGAENWSELGEVPGDTVYTVDVDPAAPSHIYVTTVLDNVGQLLRSNDEGRSFTAYPIPNTDIGEPPYLAALHPSEPDRIYVRTDAWATIDGNLTANDALLYSNDGGATWTELFRNRAKMLGFALSPDGRTLLLGYGDPFAGGTTSTPGPLGIFKGTTDAYDFTRIFDAHVGCLSWTKQGVYVCASQHFDKFEVALSPDADFSSDAGCLAPLLRLPEIRGPLACAAGTAGSACNVYWQAVCGVLGSCADAGTIPPGCAGRDAPIVDGGVDMRDADTVDGGAPPTPVGEGADCGCRVRRGGSGAPYSGGAVLAVVIALSRRRRDHARKRLARRRFSHPD
jgi:photosystem II stability/assembly factor-like uncharacterized protein